MSDDDSMLETRSSDSAAQRVVEQLRGASSSSAAEAVSGVEAWRELLDGKWFVIDRFEQRGRRFWIARHTAPSVAGRHRLSPLERRIVSQLVNGCSQKHIAYELGLAESTVSKHAAVARNKLGIKSCAELVELYATLSSSAQA